MKFVCTLRGQVSPVPPVWLMRQAGRYLPEYRELRQKAPSFLQFCLDVDKAVEVTLQPIHRFGFDAAIIFSDILMLPYGLGQEVSFLREEGPKLGGLPPSEFNQEAFHERVKPVYQAITETRRLLSPEKALIGFAGAPWTVLTYMFEGGTSKAFDRTREVFFGQPELFQKYLDLVIQATISYLREQIRAGADVIQLFDSWAGQAPALMREKVIYQATAQIIQAIQKDFPNTPIIGFPRGLSYGLEEYVTHTGVTAVGLDSFIDPFKVNVSVPLQGGLDPTILAIGGEALRTHTHLYLEAFQKVPYVFNLGHGILPHTPIAHVEELLRIIHG